MACVLNDFYLYYGWKYFWCDPCTNTFPKEYVKGPFSNPKLASPLPYVSLCQTEGELLKIRTGIPDCWGEYLIHQLFGDYDSMHKEDVDIAHNLRKDYRIYLGQGIPNPSITPYHVGFLNCRGLKENLRKFLFQISEHKNKSRKGNCLCCEKNYLLQCPDKSNTKNRTCTCKTCHSKDTDFEDQCRCIEILQNWVSKDIHLKERRLSGGKRNEAKHCRCSSGSSGCDTDDERTVVSSRKTCICPKNLKMAFNSVSSGNSNMSCIERESKHEEYIFGKDFLYKGFTEKKGGFGFLPYTGNILRGNKCLRFKDRKAVSKQIQTESQVIGDTKTVQTENVENKIQISKKCFRCTLYQHQYSTCKLPLENTVCVSPGIIKNHAIIYPCTCHDHLQNPKSYWVNLQQKKKKEIPKKDYKKNSKMEDNILDKHKIIDNFKTSEGPRPASLSKITKTVGYQPYLRSFDNLKYLTDSRLKNYLRERETLRRFQNKTSQSLNEGTKFSSVVREEPLPCEKFEKFKFLHRSGKISGSSSAEDLNKAEECTSLPKNVDRGVMTGAEEGTRKKELITKYVKDVFESDDSRTYGLVRGHENNRKRRKLACNKKRRKTYGRKKIKNQTSKLVNKNVQVEPGERNGNSPRDDKKISKFRECNFKFKQIGKEFKKPEQKSFVELFNRPLRSEQHGDVRGKVNRSPDVMKFIVGDLIIDEKSKT